MPNDQEIVDTSSNSAEDVAAALADPNLPFDEFERLRAGGKLAVETVEELAPEPVAAPVAQAPEEDEEPEADQGKPKASGYKRLKEANDRLKAENEELKQSRANPPKETPEPSKPATDGKPKIEDYPDIDSWEEAKYEWRQGRKAAQDRLEAHKERLAEAKKTHGDDFSEAMETVNAMQVFQNTADAITESPHSAEILFHLGQDPKEAKRFERLSEREQIKEVGRIEARLADAGNAPPPKLTASKPKPAPITPIRGASQAAMVKSLADMEFPDFERTRNEQEMKRRRAGG